MNIHEGDNFHQSPDLASSFSKLLEDFKNERGWSKEADEYLLPLIRAGVLAITSLVFALARKFNYNFSRPEWNILIRLRGVTYNCFCQNSSLQPLVKEIDGLNGLIITGSVPPNKQFNSLSEYSNSLLNSFLNPPSSLERVFYRYPWVEKDLNFFLSAWFMCLNKQIPLIIGEELWKKIKSDLNRNCSFWWTRGDLNP